jgi:hypothetical protein
VDEREPLAGAVVVELRRVEDAAVEERRGRSPVCRVVPIRGHELVEVFEPGIVAHVGHRAPVPRQDHRRSLVGVASEPGVLDRNRRRIVRVDLHDPAEPVRLVRLLQQVEPVVVEAPGHVPATSGAEGVSLVELRRPRGGVRVDLAPEVMPDVLLAGEDRAPRRHAARAVVERAEGLCACRVGAGPHERVASGRSPDHHGRGPRDPAVQGGVTDDPPFALAGSGDLDHREAMRGYLDVAHFAGPFGLAVPGGPHQLRVSVLVVHAEQAAGGAVARGRQRHEADEVVVVAELPLLPLRGLGAQVQLGSARKDRVAPAEEHRVLVPRGQQQLVLVRGLDGGEREPGLGRRRAPRHEPRRAGRQAGRGTGEKPAAGEPGLEDRLEGWIRARVDLHLVVEAARVGSIHDGSPLDRLSHGLRWRASARNESRLWAGRNASTCGSAACMPCVSGW